MRILRRRPWGVLLSLALLAPAPAAYAAFECPVKAPPTTKAMPDLGTIIKPYDDPRDDPSLTSAITMLKHEGVMNGEIVDHVVASYCPAVDRIPKLSDHDKDMLVTRFASHLAEVVYAPAHAEIEAIILDVPVPPSLYSKVKEAADQHHENQDAFVLRALRQATGTP